MNLLRSIPGLTLRAAALGGLFLGGASFASADYKESYRKGMEAFDKQNWPEVARRMREAAAEQSKEGERLKLYGMRFEPYLPSFYLGMALANTGDCGGALAAFAASEGQGAVRKSGNEWKALTRQKTTCEAKVGQVKPAEPPRPSDKPAGPDPAAVAAAVRTAETSLATADQYAREVAGLQGDPALAGRWGQDPQLGGSHKQATDLLAGSRARLEAGRRGSDLAALREAHDQATRAGTALLALKQTATQRRDEARRAEVKAAEPLKTTPSSPGATSPVSTAPAVTAQSGPPAALVTAAQAFFDGRYREAEAGLAGASYPAGRSGAQALLLRAASRYALFVLGGEKDDALQKNARADAVACRRMDPGFTPDPGYFSPRFVGFFKTAN